MYEAGAAFGGIDSANHASADTGMCAIAVADGRMRW